MRYYSYFPQHPSIVLLVSYSTLSLTFSGLWLWDVYKFMRFPKLLLNLIVGANEAWPPYRNIAIQLGTLSNYWSQFKFQFRWLNHRQSVVPFSFSGPVPATITIHIDAQRYWWLQNDEWQNELFWKRHPLCEQSLETPEVNSNSVHKNGYHVSQYSRMHNRYYEHHQPPIHHLLWQSTTAYLASTKVKGQTKLDFNPPLPLMDTMHTKKLVWKTDTQGSTILT